MNKPSKIYRDRIRYRNNGILSGQGDKFMTWAEVREEFSEMPVVMEFLDDDDLQEMTVASTCIGFVKTFTKEYA